MMKKSNDMENIEATLGNLLKIGVFIAGSVVVTGAMVFLIRHGFEIPSYHIFKPDSFNFSNFKNLFSGLLALKSVSIMELGILLLIAVPVLRILFSLFAFAYQKDYLYVVFTSIVLAVLILSFLS